MHLKGLVTHFREMALFTILWLTISEIYLIANASMYRSINPQVFLRKGVLNICSKFTGKHPCQSVISIKLLCNFIEITLRHGCSTVNLLHIFRSPFPRNTSGWLLLENLDLSTKICCSTNRWIVFLGLDNRAKLATHSFLEFSWKKESLVNKTKKAGK